MAGRHPARCLLMLGARLFQTDSCYVFAMYLLPVCIFCVVYRTV